MVGSDFREFGGDQSERQNLNELLSKPVYLLLLKRRLQFLLFGVFLQSISSAVSILRSKFYVETALSVTTCQ